MDTWQLPSNHLILSEDVVHVWKADLNLPAEQLDRLRNTLSSDELSRAVRFRFERHQRRYTAGRGILRSILGRYVDIPPAQLRFEYTQHGKPYLSSETWDHGLKFNLAHSGDVALYALTYEREIGVDIERVRNMTDHTSIAERFFSPGEIMALNALPAESRTEGFFDLWTRKEAYIKGQGQGLSLPLNTFDVSLSPGTPPPQLSDRNYVKEINGWLLCNLAPGGDYAGALAVKGQGWTMHCWQWCPESSFPKGRNSA